MCIIQMGFINFYFFNKIKFRIKYVIEIYQTNLPMCWIFYQFISWQDDY